MCVSTSAVKLPIFNVNSYRSFAFSEDTQVILSEKADGLYAYVSGNTIQSHIYSGTHSNNS